jgi:hypothetical protein
LKTLTDSEYFFEKLTKVSQGNNVLEIPSSNTDDFLLIGAHVTSILLKRCILNKVNVLPLANAERQEHSLQKLTQFSSGNIVVDSPASNIYGFLPRDI